MPSGRRMMSRNQIIGAVVAIIALATTAWHVNAASNDRADAIGALRSMQTRVDDLGTRLAVANVRLRRDHAEAQAVRAAQILAQVALDQHRAQLAMTEADRDHSTRIR